MNKRLLAGLFGCLFSATASASLIFSSSILLSAQGFGNAPRDLTIEETGPGADGVESGCVGVSTTGTIVIGPAGCTGDALILGNGVVPVGGDEPPPLVDDNKYGIPTLASLGITSANQIGILFNATEPGGDSVNVTDITLNFFSSTGTLLTSIDGQHNFANTIPGNGVAGFVFVVDAAQQAILNATVFNPVLNPGFGNFVLSLNSTITNIDGGPETFLMVNLDTTYVPEPGGTLGLLGIGLLGGLAIMSRRSVRNRKAA